MRYFQISIPANEASTQEILVALLGNLGFEAFEQREDSLLAFLPADDFDAASLDALLEPHGLSYTITSLEERNWNAEWESSFQPVIVDDFCAVRAHFHHPIAGVAHELIITPKMSFGTGHHATTYMMMQTMQYMDFRNRRVLDFGAGTGVLAILAERLGAKEVIAVDNDDWCIENARENITANHCTRTIILKEDAIPEPGHFDIVLANINKNVILAQLPAIRQHLNPGGVILLSGLLESDFEDIENEAVKNNLPISKKIAKSGWICLQAEKGE